MKPTWDRHPARRGRISRPRTRLTAGPSKKAPAMTKEPASTGPSSALSPRRPLGRRGMALLFVLAALAVLAALLGSLLKMAAINSRRNRTQFYRAQAEWLARSALERAVARLGEDADYPGETWNVSAAELADDLPAAVRIVVGPDTSGTQRRLVKVEADYPADTQHRCQAALEVTVDLPPATAQQTGEAS